MNSDLPNPTSVPHLSPVLHKALWLGLLVILALVLLPTLSRSHVEGFTYLTETMSLLWRDVSATDPIWDISYRYFYVSRPGTIWLMAPLSALVPGAGYDLLMWIMMPAAFSGLIVLTKLWTGATWLGCTAALLFIPLMLDVQFFHNDNLAAFSFAVWGLALVTWSKRGIAIFAAGMFLAIAILCRLDQLLLLPLFFGIAVIGAPRISVAALRVGLMAAGVLAMHGLAALLDPQVVNLFYRIDVVTGADALWRRGNFSFGIKVLRDSAAAMLAFGAGLPAILYGYKILAERRRDAQSEGLLAPNHLLLLLLLIYPVLIYGVTVGKYYDPRGFMTVVPLIAPAIALAIDRHILLPISDHDPNDPEQRKLPLALMLLFLVVPGVPPIADFTAIRPESENAVPTLTGRVWYGHSWRHWQQGFERAEDEATALMDAVQETSEPAIIISTQWTLDRLLQSTMATQGYRPVPSQLDACQDYVEAWQKPGGSTLYHLRTHVPFFPNGEVYTAALFQLFGENCIRQFDPNRRFTMTTIIAATAETKREITLTPEPGGFFKVPDSALETLAADAYDTLVEGDPDIDAVAEVLLGRAHAVLNGQ
ncbi:hypothetical protein [Yoonia sp. BS5-3]|uniref:Glycosyltransferase RgtA/B/C/D-like domain-containing protein n=1 Tax=Yoonia phaeophyticola TaxID=3137369 RepID=A0ABZ2V6X7_9RHOB